MKREAQKIGDTWDLCSLYSSKDVWKQEKDAIESSMLSISEFAGRLNSVEIVTEALNFHYGNLEKLEGVYTYAHLLLDQDTTHTEHKAMYESAIGLWSSYSSASSFIAPELIANGVDFLENLLQEASLSHYNFYIKELIREQEFILSKEEEKILSLSSEAISGSRDIFGQLNNADLKFQDIDTNEGPKPLTHGSFITFLQNPDREIRRQAYEKYYQSFDEHKYTLSATLLNNLKKDTFITRARGYESSLKRALFNDNIPESVYLQLIDTISENLEPLHDYYSMRGEILSIKDQKLYDTYVPLITDSERGFSYDESVDLICEAVTPLGSEYVDTLRKGLTSDRWVDKYENEGKRSGAYSSGSYHSAPYILMNYKDTGFESLFTLAHEAGHSMHSYYSSQTQTFPNYSYTIFVAEVASTFNELLLIDHLKKKFKDDLPLQAYLLNYLVDSIKSTVYRQTMFAEFELESHKLADAAQALTLDSFRKIHGDLQKKYFGKSVLFTEVDSLECLRIPHFYSSFYVYKYATGMAAAAFLSKQILEGKSPKDYLEFLSSGSSDYSLNLLKKAGVDLESNSVVEAVAQLLAETVGDFRSIHSKLKE